MSRRLGEVGCSWRLAAHTLELRQQACFPAADHAHHFREQSTELSRRKRLHEAEAARWQHKETTGRLKLESVDAEGRARIARVGVRKPCCFVFAELVRNRCLLTGLGDIKPESLAIMMYCGLLLKVSSFRSRLCVAYAFAACMGGNRGAPSSLGVGPVACWALMGH